MNKAKSIVERLLGEKSAMSPAVGKLKPGEISSFVRKLHDAYSAEGYDDMPFSEWVESNSSGFYDSLETLTHDAFGKGVKVSDDQFEKMQDRLLDIIYPMVEELD